MTEFIIKYRKYALFVLAGAVFLVLSFLKSGFYVDEIYSYGHANSTNGAFLTDAFNSGAADKKEVLHHRWLDGKIFHNYLTAKESGRFSYAHITQNLREDVHPPLFYFLLYTVSSFFPDTFHKALGLGLNFIILFLLVYWFYKLAQEVFGHEDKAFLATAFFLFIPVVLEMQIYIRMYLLEMALMTGLWWQTFVFFDDEKISYKRLLFIFCLALLSFLTHYYALIMIFFLTATVCLVLLLQKKYRKALIFGTDILLALAAAFLLFKDAYQVLFFSDRGLETKQAVADFNWQFLLDTAAFFWLQICRSLAHVENISAWILLPVVLVFLICAKINTKGIILLCAGVAAGLVIACIAPNMGEYNGRYYGGILVPLFLVSVMVIDNLFHNKAGGKIVFGLWLLFSVSQVYLMSSSSYLQRDSEVYKICAVTKGKEVILQRQLFISIFQLAPCWQNAKKIYVIGHHETPENVLNEATKGTVFIQEVGQGTKKYPSHALYAKKLKLGLSYIGMYRADKILYDVYEKKETAF